MKVLKLGKQQAWKIGTKCNAPWHRVLPLDKVNWKIQVCPIDIKDHVPTSKNIWNVAEVSRRSTHGFESSSNKKKRES